MSKHFRNLIAGTAAVVAGIVVGAFSYGFMMRVEDGTPAMLDWIPYAGPWLRFLLAGITGFITFAMTVAAVWQKLEAPKI